MSLEKVKSILYDVLTADDNGQNNLEPVIKATQNMGVTVSSAVMKNGVNVFQLQNVVHQKVIKNVVEALRVIDRIDSLPIPVEPLLIQESSSEYQKTLEEEIEEALDNEVSYSSFIKEIGQQFIFAAIKRHDVLKEAAIAIKISYSKLMQVKRTPL